MPSRKSYSCGGVIIGRPSDRQRDLRERRGERVRKGDGKKDESFGRARRRQIREKKTRKRVPPRLFSSGIRNRVDFLFSRSLLQLGCATVAAAATSGVACFT